MAGRIVDPGRGPYRVIPKVKLSRAIERRDTLAQAFDRESAP